MKIKKHIPNFITCLNLASGVLGIILSFESLIYSSWLILLAGFFDFIDGFAARILKVSSPIGAELDSLADVVSFGVLPGIITWHLMDASLVDMQLADLSFPNALIYLSILIPAFSALRLAKFNIDTRQSFGFIGLPTPANAIFFASLPLILQAGQFDFILNIYLLSAVAVIMSLLLVSEVPLMALKFKSFSFSENSDKFILILASVLLIVLFSYLAIPLIIILYILLSLVFSYLKSPNVK